MRVVQPEEAVSMNKISKFMIFVKKSIIDASIVYTSSEQGSVYKGKEITFMDAKEGFR